MKEATIQKWVRDQLAATFGIKCVYVKYHAGQYASRGVSDLLFCIHGRFVAVEVKTETGKATPLQINFINNVIQAGGLGYVIYGRDANKIREIIDDIESSLPR
ncbi:MAG: VRR-NUC domain-containing protein [bacterium]